MRGQGPILLKGAIVGAFLTLLPGFPAMVAAQEVERPTLTLSEALERAQRSNPSYRRTVNNIELNAIEARSAWLEFLPDVNVNLLSTSTNWNRTPVATDPFGLPIENPETGTIRNSQTQQGGGIFFTFDAGSWLRMRQQRIQADTRELTLLTEGVALRASVTSAFMAVQEAQGSVELEQELLESARTNLEVVERLFTLARRDRTDLLGAELEVAEQESAVERAEADLESALLELRNLIGDPDLRDFRIVPTELVPFDPERLDEEALVDAARDEGPRVRQAETALEVEQRNRSIQRSQWLPTVSLSYTTSRSSVARQRTIRDADGNIIGQFQGDEAFFDFNPDADWGSNFGLTIRLPDLGTYFNRRNAAAQNEVNLRNQRESVRESRQEVEQEVRSLVLTLRSSHRDLYLQGRRAALAEERFALTMDAYRLGQRSFMDIQNGSREVAQARRAELQARYAMERARVNLERALGLPLDQFFMTDGGR